ncbi:MAG: GAF domain-containing protein [Deltaproteobacteria bacterium]|nr:GAF domain-containing protein [Deltaproteobacteria bacterium]
MANHPDIHLRDTTFLVFDGPTTRKVEIPKGLNVQVIGTFAELTAHLSSARSTNRRCLLVIDGDSFAGIRSQLKQLGIFSSMHRFGCLVVAKDPGEFLRLEGGFHDVLDIVAERHFRKDVEFHLYKAVRHLINHEGRQNPRISQKTLERMNEIFISLSAERNPQKLLASVLVKAMELTMAEGGTLYLVQEVDGELYFKTRVSNDRSTEIHIEQISLKVMENSHVGHVALTGKIIKLTEAEEIRTSPVPSLNRAYDHDSDRVRYAITVPLRSGRNEIIAVLQMVNKKSEQVLTDEGTEPGDAIAPFVGEDEAILSSFATQAATCLENVELYGDIQKLFEGFVRASITAIESRDPSTGGHSERVAKMSVSLAQVTSDCSAGIYRSVRFKEEEIRELEYAALLHDFGKIGIREEVLIKAKKLYDHQLVAINERLKICKAAARILYLEKKLRQVAEDPNGEREYEKRIQELDGYWNIILTANEPTVLRKENIEALERIRNEQLILPDGSQVALLNEDEYRALSVTKGSLTDSERLEIESHVRHTYQFLKMIPWTRDFRHLPEIAYCHHEKLDGSGYPRGLVNHEIPLQSKIMAIVDIFDALTAADRWYKEAVPIEKALDILFQEVALGKLDPVLVELFVEKKIYEVTHPKAFRQVVG